MPRFFVPLPLASGTRVALPEELAHHALRVLRLRAGDEVTLFDGSGGEYRATLVEAAHGGAALEVGVFDAREAELPYRACIAQGLSAAEKMDWTLEKAVELGAASLQPLAMQRSVTRLSPERAEKRLAHWQQIARAATEQCGRNRVATVHALAEFEVWVQDTPRAALKLMLDPGAQASLARVPRAAPGVGVILLIGPEAGMAPAEKAAALAKGFLPVTLGPRVLRTETAAAVALATLGAAWHAEDGASASRG